MMSMPVIYLKMYKDSVTLLCDQVIIARKQHLQESSDWQVNLITSGLVNLANETLKMVLAFLSLWLS